MSYCMRCLLFAHLERHGHIEPTLAGTQQLLTILGPEMLIEICYPLSGSCVNAKELYDKMSKELDDLIAVYGENIEVKGLLHACLL
jgi:hypothetical protein